MLGAAQEALMANLDKTGCIMLDVPKRLVAGRPKRVVTSGRLTLYSNGDGYWQNDIRNLAIRSEELRSLLENREVIEKPMPEIQLLSLPARFFFRTKYTRWHNPATGLRVSSEPPADQPQWQRETFTHPSVIEIATRVASLAGVRWKMPDGTPFETHELNELVRRGVIDHLS